MGTVAGETVTKTVFKSPAAYSRCKVHKGCSPFFQPENSCYSMFFVTIFVFPAQPRPGPAASLQCDLSRENCGGLEPFSLLKALDKLFQQTLFCPPKWILSPIPGLSFLFIHDFSRIKQCVYEFHQMWQMEFLKWHF